MKTWKQWTLVAIIVFLEVIVCTTACDNNNGNETSLDPCDVVWHWSDDTLDATKDHTGCTVVPTATAEHKAGTLRLVNATPAKDETGDCYVMFDGQKTLVKHDTCDHAPGERLTNHGNLPVTDRYSNSDFDAQLTAIEEALNHAEEYFPENLVRFVNRTSEIRVKSVLDPEEEIYKNGIYTVLDGGGVYSEFLGLTFTHPELIAQILPQSIKIAKMMDKGHLLATLLDPNRDKILSRAAIPTGANVAKANKA